MERDGLSPVETARDQLSQQEIDAGARAVARKVEDRVGLLLLTAALWAYVIWSLL